MQPAKAQIGAQGPKHTVQLEPAACYVSLMMMMMLHLFQPHQADQMFDRDISDPGT